MGISCGVLVAPVLPGLSDSEDQLREVVEACADAGAVSMHGVTLHLRGTVRAHYFDWLEGARPDLVRLHRAGSGEVPTRRTPNASGSRGSCVGRRCAAVSRVGTVSTVEPRSPHPGAGRPPDASQQLRLL